jgi:hypothetical protein
LLEQRMNGSRVGLVRQRSIIRSTTLASKLALFNAMELVSNQTIEGDVIARRSGGIVCSTHRSHVPNICTMTIEATAPFAKQVR